MSKRFDPFHPLLKSDPYALFREYAVNGPIQRGDSSMPGYDDTWYFLGFEEARTLLRSNLHEPLHRVESSAAANGVELTEERAAIWKHLSEWPLFQSPPLHTERRALVANAFRQPALEKFAESIRTDAEALLDKSLSTNGIEMQQQFSYPLAVTAITRILGLPSPDIAWFKSVTKRITDVLDLGYVPQAYVPGLAALNELVDYAEEAIAWKRNHLADDLLSSLICPLEGNAELAVSLITSLITQILLAGQETVADGIGNGVNLLASHPEQLLLLRKKPQLIDNAVQEILRFDCPVLFTSSRTVTRDMQFGDTRIAAGEATIVVLGACNRDGRRFSDPDIFNIERDMTGTEISFGHGIHYCLGAHFARMVMCIGLQQLLLKSPGTWAVETPVNWRNNTVFRGPIALALSFQG